MRWFSSRVTWPRDTVLVWECGACVVLWLVFMRFDFRQPVLIRFSRIREERGGEMALFPGDLGLRRLPCVGM